MSDTHSRSGDGGWTGLANGKRVKKYSDIIELRGCIDELNVALGYTAEALCSNKGYHTLLKQVYRIQKDLLELGTHLVSGTKFAIDPHKISKLEVEIDVLSDPLPVLKSALIPSGGECALRFYLVRGACRRAERVAFKLADADSSAEIVGVYFNRLGEWLYVAARSAALIANIEETVIASICD